MKLAIFVLVAVLGAASARPQYTYPRPTTTERPFEGYRYPKPQPTYLPPPPPTTTQPPQLPYQQERVISPVYSAPEEEYKGHGAYDFTYSVKDAEYNNDYTRSETSEGDVIRGEYRILLPDGRTQVVKYVADWRNGFNADVSYIGEARYDP